MKWDTENEWKSNRVCEDISNDYLKIKEKQRESEEKANEPVQIYADFENRGCFDRWGYLTDNVDFC